jgi:hypothetical protein
MGTALEQQRTEAAHGEGRKRREARLDAEGCDGARRQRDPQKNQRTVRARSSAIGVVSPCPFGYRAPMKRARALVILFAAAGLACSGTGGEASAAGGSSHGGGAGHGGAAGGGGSGGSDAAWSCGALTAPPDVCYCERSASFGSTTCAAITPCCVHDTYPDGELCECLDVSELDCETFSDPDGGPPGETQERVPTCPPPPK